FGYAAGTSGWKLGENLAWGKRRRGSAREVFKAWLDSPPHRSTLLNGAFEHVGIGLKRGHFDGSSQSAVWVLELGCRGC
ncbi:MAG: CAP domain-containing protein, partial [Solirubrobacterales bacterium]